VTGLTVPTWVLIFRPKISQMPQNLSAQFVCLSTKVLDFNEKRLHGASIVRGCSYNKVTQVSSVRWNGVQVGSPDNTVLICTVLGLTRIFSKGNSLDSSILSETVISCHLKPELSNQIFPLVTLIGFQNTLIDCVYSFDCLKKVE
jgi:hypothetical protein